jgi:hypothetical protein
VWRAGLLHRFGYRVGRWGRWGICRRWSFPTCIIAKGHLLRGEEIPTRFMINEMPTIIPSRLRHVQADPMAHCFPAHVHISVQ